MTNKAIVSYVGGYGGDIFSTLLLSNFESGIEPTQSFEQPIGQFLNRYSAPVEYCRSGRGINDFFKLVSDIDNPSIETKYLKEYFKDDLYNVYDANDDVLVEKFVAYCRSYLYVDETLPFVIPTHYTTKVNDRFAKFDIDDILPGSVKLRLNSNPEHVPLFRGLAKYKNQMPSKFPLSDLTAMLETLEQDIIKETDDYLQQLATPLPRFIDIDVSDLWLRGGSSVDYLQTVLIGLFGVPIDMDKNFIDNTYNPNNKEILVSIFGSRFLDNTYETNRALLVNYVINTFRQVINA